MIVTGVSVGARNPGSVVGRTNLVHYCLTKCLLINFGPAPVPETVLTGYLAVLCAPTVTSNFYFRSYNRAKLSSGRCDRSPLWSCLAPVDKNIFSLSGVLERQSRKGSVRLFFPAGVFDYNWWHDAPSFYWSVTTMFLAFSFPYSPSWRPGRLIWLQNGCLVPRRSLPLVAWESYPFSDNPRICAGWSIHRPCTTFGLKISSGWMR